MSHKADLISAFSHRQPAGAVPIWELEFHAWNAASGGHMVLGAKMERLSPAEQERALYRNAEIIVSVSRELEYAAVTVPGGYWHQSPGQLAYYVLPESVRFQQVQILRELAGDDLMLIANSGGVLSADYSEEFCDKLFNAPEEVDAMCQQRLDGGVQLAGRLGDLGVEAVFSASDIADNSGPFFNPQQMQRFVLPYLDRWAQACKQMGLFSILHTDGRLTPYIDAIAATAVDAMQAIDPVAGMDMAQTQAIAGDRLCLCGNIDCGLLLRGTPQQVYAATQTLLQTCKGGGNLVLGASNAVQAEVPMPNYRAMIDARNTFGRYVTSCLNAG